MVFLRQSRFPTHGARLAVRGPVLAARGLSVATRVAAFAIIAALAGVRADARQTTLENDVKAAFLFNFTKFIEWPPQPPTGEPFRVCVLADSDFASSVDATIAEEAIAGRRMVRVTPQSPDEARTCSILYVGRSQSERNGRALAAVRDLPVLTVGEGPEFLKQGGAIGFVLENHRVRFDISTLALQKAGLKASSKLLRVARTLEPGGVR